MKKLNQVGMGIFALVGVMAWSASAQAMSKKKPVVEQDDSGAIVIIDEDSESHSDEIRVGVPAYGGTGCPAGSVGVTLSSTGDTEITLPFDQYTTSVDGRTLDRRACNIAIPVSVSAGYQVALGVVEISGDAQILDQNAYAQINSEVFFAGSRGEYLQQKLENHSGAFTLGGTLAEESLQWSACGAQVIARVNSNIVQMRGLNRDTGDFVRASQMRLQMITRPCAAN